MFEIIKQSEIDNAIKEACIEEHIDYYFGIIDGYDTLGLY